MYVYILYTEFNAVFSFRHPLGVSEGVSPEDKGRLPGFLPLLPHSIMLSEEK
jgi:hypothetical protein